MDPSVSDPSPDDAFLLRCYVRDGSAAAFRTLAERHLPLVWSVARRVSNGDAAMAEDVAQAVLADFARKAHTLPPGTVAAGWLHRHTVFTASKAVRSEVRRRAREQASAVEEASDPMNERSDTWTELAPHLDLALDRLTAADRTAIILRYFEQRALRDVGRMLGTTEEAARKRIDRALTKLRNHLKRRGVVPAVAIFAAMLQRDAIAAPPSAAARRILSGAWSHVESGTPVAAAASRPWWRRRSAMTGAAAALLLVGFLWIALRNGFVAGSENLSGHPRHIVSGNPPATAGSAEVLKSVTLTATLITLPEKNLFVRMADYMPGSGDAALYRELFPQAEALQALVKPEETFATTGHPLVVLSGAAKLHRMAEMPSVPVTPEPEPADPFAATPPFPELKPPASSIKLQRIKEFSYLTEWNYDDDEGRVKPVSPTSRDAGTTLEANVYQPDAEGRYRIECNVDHMFAPPENESWPYRWPDGKPEDVNDAVKQPVFHNFQWHTAPLLLPAGEVVLAGMMTLPSDAYPEGASEPRRLFLFLHLQP